ncbi:conserved hypothetical protein [Xenorhabdus innexi]|uniref:NgrE n=2 Tax=Xenorhabdus innexi TaxID=290109 RepID=A0A1N6N136_9GAMM|nr:hypothetical protein [Xenorhabdus innexi]PHM36451.1 NgrE [Xenorhabdus innexi]SIP74732.1 conserved hypothetical protein [Xenorhabdus innexi]
MIYTQGTISTVSGSAFVRGTGTQFKDNLNGVAPGQVILIQSGSSNLLHMIQAVNSDTELVLADKATVTLNKVTYQIQTTVPNSISDGVRHLVAINSHIITFLQNMDKWMSQNGTVDVTLPNGQTVSLQSIKKMNEAIAQLNQSIDKRLEKAKNGADIPNKSEFVRHIGLNDVLKIRDYGLGTNSMNTQSLMGDTRDTQYNTGFYGYTPSTTNQVGNHGSIIKTAWSHNNYQMIILPNYGNTVMYVQRCDNGKPWETYTVMTSNMWTIDGSGYYKKSSPIIEIHPDGDFTTNDESEGATVTKLDTGHYQVSGVLGYNADKAWGVHGGISSPKNNNGLELIYIDDKVNKDGSITIETFHRQHSHLPARFQNKRIKALIDGEKVYYQDGEPCDIPEGCRLDVRVQMPENSVWNLKQKEATERVADGEPQE